MLKTFETNLIYTEVDQDNISVDKCNPGEMFFERVSVWTLTDTKHLAILLVSCKSSC